jgi:hypothetical protein
LIQDQAFKLIEVYVNPNKEVKYIVCSYHNFKKIRFVNQGYNIKHFVIKVELNSHGMSFNRGGSILLVPNILKPLLKPYFKYTPAKFIPLVSSNN